MLKSISKKVGAVVLSAAMALSLAAVAPVSADAATAYTMTNKAGQEVEIGAASTYYVKGVKSTQYVKVVPRGEAKSGITVKHQGKLIKATQMVKGTKNGTFGIVTTADESVAGKQYNVWVYVYNSKTATKPVKTLKGGAVTVEKKEAEYAAKQTGVNKITVTATEAIKDTASIKVTNGSVATALATKDGIKVAADGKSVDLTTAAPLVKGEYTVTVDGKTLTVVAEDEKVASIEFVSEKAVLDAVSTNKATVAYKVYNQFGDDVTKTTYAKVELSGSGIAPATIGNEDGIVTFTSSEDYILNTSVVAAVVVYKNGANVVSKSGTFTVSAAAAVNSIEIKDGVYNKAGKVLTEDSKSTDGYYVLATAKDQYGSPITMNTGNTIISFAAGLTNITTPAAFEATKIEVAGQKYDAIKLTANPFKAGTATLILVGKGNGTTASTAITVADGAKVDAITLKFPSRVVGGEDCEVAYSAVDTYGKAITSYDALVKCDGIAAARTPGELYAVKNPVTGVATLKYAANSNPSDIPAPKVVNVVTTTFKTATAQFSVEKDAVATAIVGVKDLATGILPGAALTVASKNFVVQDQYGREMKPEKYAVSANAAVSNNFVVTAGSVTAPSPVTEAVSVKVTYNLTNKANAKYDVTYTTAPQTEVKSYEVADVTPVYCGAGTNVSYNSAIKVYGVYADGTKVELTANMFNVVESRNAKVTASGDAIVATDLTGTDKALEKVESVTETITVIVNATGDSFKKDVVLTKAAPKATAVAYKTEGQTFVTYTSGNTVTVADILGELKVNDQYLAETVDSALVKATARVTYTDLVNAKVTNNGTTLATITKDDTSASAKALKATYTVTFADGTTFVGSIAE